MPSMPMERRERSGALFPPPSPFLAAPASSLFPFPRLMLLEIQLGHRRPSEEEDRYDRVAFGKEYAAERVYVSEIMDVSINMSITIVRDLLDDAVDEICGFSKYPQADLGATSGRLREHNGSAKGAPHSTTRTKECPTVEMQAMKARDISVKPILKRKEEHVDSKPRKRYADVKAVELSEHDDSHMVPQSMNVVTTKDNSTPSESHGVPNYVRSPSKYTCYTLENAREY